ncbi:heavy metal-binding domain-containing protein [Corynebacterium halotolerans]|uniref:Uncharacterized protein n=1 Tax=Corynebacterium halotolerans YIM 70093 = DSM 44683 TaxID=1121362 RepID=M1NII5_9CORY|nr:YbjQ family protein [Corynebacterium halotolerans]AGF71233.1 hypothetical protein A605_01095 [Corynebacterium halotolerans YIM 70093 = DSM 44683]
MDLIVTTTNSVDGLEISRYVGIVIGDQVIDTSRFRNPTSDDPDISGQREVERARGIALEEMKARAVELHAEAVVSVVFNHQMVGPDNTLLLVSATGTAVRLKTPAQ